MQGFLRILSTHTNPETVAPMLIHSHDRMGHSSPHYEQLHKPNSVSQHTLARYLGISSSTVNIKKIQRNLCTIFAMLKTNTECP